MEETENDSFSSHPSVYSTSEDEEDELLLRSEVKEDLSAVLDNVLGDEFEVSCVDFENEREPEVQIFGVLERLKYSSEKRIVGRVKVEESIAEQSEGFKAKEKSTSAQPEETQIFEKHNIHTELEILGKTALNNPPIEIFIKQKLNEIEDISSAKIIVNEVVQEEK